MKAQIRMIVASVIIIALALTAVSGITYSWFSDTEKTEVNVSTATLDLKLTIDDENIINSAKSIGTGVTYTSGSIGVTDIAANAAISIPYLLQYKASISTVACVVAEFDLTGITGVDTKDNVSITFNGTTKTLTEISNDSSKMIVKNWTVFDKADEYTDIINSSVTITTPTTWTIPEDSEGNMVSDSFEFTIKAELYQGDYPYEPMTVDGSTATANLPANKVVKADKIQYTESGTTTSQEVTNVVMDFSNVSTVDDSSTAIASQEVKMTVSSIADNKVTLNLSMTDVTSPKFDQPAVITMTVPGEISNPKVVYNGTEEDATVLSSTINSDSTTTIVFSVKHFSEYVIKEDKGEVETKYELQKALAAGGNVRLGENITIDMQDEISARFYVGNDSMQTLNLNGKTLTIKSVSDDSSNNFAAFYVNGNFTITGNGELVTAEADSTGSATKCMYGFDVLAGGHLTIENGTYVCGGTAVQVEGLDSTVVINGGTFNTIPFDQTTYKYKFTLNYIDKIWKDTSRTGSIQVFGGSFLEYDPADSLSENPRGSFCADGYATKSTTESGKTIWTVVPAVAVVTDSDGNVVGYYADFFEALSAVPYGGTLTLLDDVDLSETITI